MACPMRALQAASLQAVAAGATRGQGPIACRRGWPTIGLPPPSRPPAGPPAPAMFDASANPRQRFVEDELMRVPMLADQVLTATWPALQQALPTLAPAARAAAAELLAAQRQLHLRFVEHFAAAVRRQLRERERDSAAAPVAPAAAGAARLALLDESAVATDVEVSRALQAVRSIAEHELRELNAYTAALAGDMDVSRDHNPLHPEVFVRALSEATQGLPVGPAQRLLLMRHAGTPLAQVLRKAYAGAVARLEAAGLTAAAYRTLVPQPGTRGWRPDESWTGPLPDLRARAEAMRAPARRDPPAHPAADATPATGRHAPDAVTADLLARLFEAMLADQRLSRDVRGVLAQLNPVAGRIAADDPSLLTQDQHALWRFVDELVFQAGLFARGSSARDAQLALSESLVTALARATAPDAAGIDRARIRLAEAARQRFQARLSAVAEDVDVLQALEEDEATSQDGMPTGFGPLDASQLDTVPAELMDALSDAGGDASPQAAAWLDRLRPGDWVQLFTQGQWLQAQLLWQGRRGDVWLFGQGQTARTTALRRRAIERLADEGLLRPLVRRSILRSAAARLLRDGDLATH